MSRIVEGLVKSGQHNNLMSISSIMWESTTIAGIQISMNPMECGRIWESGATPLIQMRNGSIALFQYVVHQHTTARKAIHWGPAIQEG